MNKKIAVVLALLMLPLLIIGSYNKVINEEYAYNRIPVEPFDMFVTFETEGLIYKVDETWSFEFKESVQKMHGRRLTENFVTKYTVTYGIKGNTISIDDNNRIAIPIRIIDLRSESIIHDVIWKLYQEFTGEYWVYYVSEADEQFKAIMNKVALMEDN